ncbi:hypothetical protein [Oscillibacter sp.]|nr:hypothetical protein [Oscillibacter sp.]MDD3346570.1 hypothetical protein [Oscillibacter sp.]
MMIEVLVCREDGTQVLEQKQVPDDYFTFRQEEAPSEESAAE